jgi:hypothetical protein
MNHSDCDGDTVREMAGTLGVETSAIDSAACALMRDFVTRGFLLPPAQETI